MRTRTGRWAAAALLAMGPSALAQETVDDRMERFEQRLDEIEQRHQEELRARDREIARLREQIRQQPPPATQPAAEDADDDEIEATRDEILRDIERRDRLLTLERTPASLNPDIAAIADFVGSYSPDAESDFYNRMDVREVELDLRAPVHPRADGVLILAFHRDVHSPVFGEIHEDEEHEGEEEHEHEGIESRAGAEEAYLLVHDTGVRNLAVKLGRFHLRFGRQNLLHLHDLPAVEPALVNQAFLSPEALTDAGIGLSYVVPNPWGQYVEAIVEVISGEGADSESPTLAGSLEVDSPAINTHLLWNTDVNDAWNLELGASHLRGHADEDNALDVRLYGADVTLIHTDPTGGFRNQVFQFETIYGDIDQEDGGTEHAVGYYLLAQQQLNRDWYAGIRLDWTENPNNDAEEAWAVNPYLTWYWTEFLRFRTQYQYRDGDVEDPIHAVFFQTTWLVGAHPPHPYWSLR